MNILLVEDNLADQMLTKEAFKMAPGDCVLHCVSDGLLALESLYQPSQSPFSDLPDIVLSDMNLPSKSGHAVLDEIKTNQDLLHIPVIILSGSLMQSDIDRSYQLGASAHVAKPSSMQEYYSLADAVIRAWSPAGFCFQHPIMQAAFQELQRA